MVHRVLRSLRALVCQAVFQGLDLDRHEDSIRLRSYIAYRILQVYLSLKERVQESNRSALWWFELGVGRALDMEEGAMPIATGVSTSNKKFELKTLEGGYVVIRRLTFGEKLDRKSFMDKVKVDSDGGGRNNKKISTEINMMNKEVTAFEFAACIVEHNLEYNAGTDEAPDIRLFDFRIPAHIRMLDGNVGDEINELIEKFNDFEADENTGKSSTSSTPAS